MFKNRNKILWREAFLCTVFTIVISGIFLLLFVNLSILDPFYKAFKDFSFTDIYYSKSLFDEEINKDVIIVNVQHHDRLTLASAIEKVEQQKPKAVGLDVVFKEKKSVYLDSVLKSTFVKYDNIVTSYYLDRDSIIENHNYFKHPNSIEGFINMNFSRQNTVVRNFIGVKNLDEKRYSFATQLALQSNKFDSKNLKKLKEQIPINYIGGPDSFLSFDIDELLAADTIPAMKNAIVIFGYLGTPIGNPFDIEDKHFTPLNSKFAGRSKPDMYGVLIHANIIKMLTNNNFLIKVPKVFIYIIALIMCYFSILLGMKLYKRSPIAYDVLIKIIQLITSVTLLYLALLLLKLNIYVFITPILVLTVFGLEIIDFYIYIAEYLKKRFQWKSYLLE